MPARWAYCSLTPHNNTPNNTFVSLCAYRTVAMLLVDERVAEMSPTSA